MCITIPSVTSIANRIGISDSGTAAIASAALHDFGIITEEDKPI